MFAGASALALGLALSACASTREAEGGGGAQASAFEASPLTVPEERLETWVWFPVEGAICGDGSPTGIAVNLTARSGNVLVFAEGGGTCWDPDTCFGAEGFPATVATLGPLDQGVFERHWAPRLRTGIFDRGDATNPLRDYNWVYLPYCTGDGHLGRRTATYDVDGEARVVHHEGRRNFLAALPRIVSTFRDAPTIALAGYSAGGLGALGNYAAFARAFAQVTDVRPALIDDAAPALEPAYLTPRAQAMLAEAWGLSETVLADCGPECEPVQGGGLHRAILRWQLEFPGMRGSLVSSYRDTTVTLLHGLKTSSLSWLQPNRLEQGLKSFADFCEAHGEEVSPSRFQVFYYGPPDERRHGALTTGALARTPGLAEFLRAQLEGDASWQSVRP